MGKNKTTVIAQGLDKERPIEQMSAERLQLDASNPRLASGPEASSPLEILRILWTEMVVDELVYSIGMNGFFPQEPLFVIPEHPEDRKTKYTVIEGNRRLAAVMILCDDDLREKLRATDMPTITREAKERLKTLPVIVYENRQQLWTYLSFRHINSTQPWDSFSKAKYVAQVHEEYGVPLKDIADRIGDRHSTVERFYRGYKVYQQAERQAKFDAADRTRTRFSFSHLYTALDYPEYQRFLGITVDRATKDNPVPRTHLKELNELMTWLYGRKSDKTEPVILKQNPHLKMLRDVIVKPASLSLLRSGYSLEKAYETSIGDRRRFREYLTSAKEELQQAKATVTTGYTGDEELFIVIEDIQEIAETIRAEMERKRSNPVSRSRQQL